MKFKLDEISVTNWILLGILIVLAVVLMLFARKKQQWNAKMLASAAICIALSFVLSYIRLFKLPQGGSVTPASLLPIIAFAYAYGAVPGLLVGFAYGLLQMIQDPYIVGVVQALLDYPLAFGCIALAGLCRSIPARCQGLAKKNPNLPDLCGWLAALALTGVGRFICHVLSGVVFFAEYADGTGLSPLVYSLSYNSFVFVDLLICFVVVLFPQMRKALERMSE